MKESLSAKELEIAKLLVLGYSQGDISEKLGIALDATKGYVAIVLDKMGIKRPAKWQTQHLHALVMVYLFKNKLMTLEDLELGVIHA